MDTRLREILNEQKALLKRLGAETDAIENSDLARENESLKAMTEKLAAELAAERQKAEKLSELSANLKNALYEQTYAEKIKLAERSARKLDAYFGQTTRDGENRLRELERNVKRKIDDLKEESLKNNIELEKDIYKRLNDLSDEVQLKTAEAQRKMAEEAEALKNDRAAFERLKDEPIAEEQLLSATKNNGFERFLGLNALNALGVFLLIVGVISAAPYTILKLPDMLKGALMFCLGIVMLVVGEFLSRKRPNAFSLGVTAGGVGVLYASIAVSYFALGIINMYAALALCVLVTTSAFVLSRRYRSQVILSFALIGGYLPVISLFDGIAANAFYGVMIYFLALNLLALMASVGEKWNVSAFIGLFLSLFVAVGILLTSYDYEVNRAIILAYVFLSFVIYTLVPIAGSYKSDKAFKKSDAPLMGINAFFSALIIYYLLLDLDLDHLTGALAVAFAAVYLALGKFTNASFKGKTPSALFYLTGLAFATFAVPLQFGRVWLSLGWLIEGVALSVYGILKNEKSVKKAGYVISSLCLAVFVLFDVFYAWIIGEYFQQMFALKYFAVTLGGLIVLAALVRAKRPSGLKKLYKYIAMSNLWLYFMYICAFADDSLAGGAYISDYCIAALAAAVTFAFAFTAARLKVLYDSGMKVMAITFYIIGIVMLFAFNATIDVYPIGRIYVAASFAALIIVWLLSVLAVADALKTLVMDKTIGIEWYPLIVSGYFVITLTQNLTSRLGLEFTSAWISIIYAITALVWIVFGFVRRYTFIRRAGLGLSILSALKLFVLDLSYTATGYRIMAYFTLGITLIAISFTYQYSSKRLELRKEDMLVDKNDA
ncbi:MAG: DUF2339 domain-containing protein [Clostridiales bacterium]|jgi:uncharacterized membrane protein|nr:DUF2339 domain-containing protein [Clostridiales bacterium]